jgi:hypothetical protein
MNPLFLFTKNAAPEKGRHHCIYIPAKEKLSGISR